MLRCPRIIWTEPVKTDSDKNPLATRGSSTPRKHTLTWLNLTALRLPWQDGETRMTTPWRKISSPSSKLNAFTATNRLPSRKPTRWLTAISTFTTMSASKAKQECRRSRCATPAKTEYFCTRGSFCAVCTIWGGSVRAGPAKKASHFMRGFLLLKGIVLWPITVFVSRFFCRFWGRVCKAPRFVCKSTRSLLTKLADMKRRLWTQSSRLSLQSSEIALARPLARALSFGCSGNRRK